MNKKKALVLMQYEDQGSPFFKNLGWSQHHPMMCHQTIPTELFNYRILGLLTADKKVDDYISVQDGIIIIFNHFDNDVYKRIHKVITLNQDKPILIVHELLDKLPGEELERINKIIQNTIKGMNNVSYHVVVSGYGGTDEFKAKDWFNASILKGVEKKEEKQQKHHTVKGILHTDKKSTSITATDHYMIRGFEDATLPITHWDHYGRLRIVYLSLKNKGYTGTVDPEGWLCRNWIKYKKTIGHGHLWNYSLTRFWVNIIHNTLLENDYTGFQEMYNTNTRLQNGILHEKYYNKETIFSPQAKKTWIRPDKVIEPF